MGGSGGDAPISIEVSENVSLDGENRGVDAEAEKRCERLDSGWGVAFEVAKDTAFEDVLLTSALFNAPSKLCMLLALLGVDCESILRRASRDEGAGRTKSIGFTVSRLSAYGPALSGEEIVESSTALPLPFRLSLRRSLMPLALRFRTAGLRNSPLVEESLRMCAALTPVVVCG